MIISRDILEAHASCFQKQYEGSGQRSLHFPDDDVEAVKVMLYWLVEQKLRPIIEKDCFLCDYLHMQCYAVGEKYDLVAFQDEVMIKIIDNFSRWADWDFLIWDLGRTISLVFEITKPDSKLREFFVEEAAWASRYMHHLFWSGVFTNST